MSKFTQVAAGLAAALAVAAFTSPANAFHGGGMGGHMGGMGHIGHMGGMGRMHGGNWSHGNHFAHDHFRHGHHRRGFAFFDPGYGYYDDYYDDDYYDCYWRHGRRYCGY